MKPILRSSEPDKFVEWKICNPGKQFNEITRRVKKGLKDALIVEQGGLCCYCECRINHENSHIEHFKPKAHDKFPDLQLEYGNLHASCGRNIESGDDSHCGHKKQDQYSDLLVSPLEADCDIHFGYKMDGRITGLDERGDESVKILRLDSELLNAQRKELIDYFLGVDDENFGIALESHLDTSKDEFGEFYTMVKYLFSND